MSTEKVTTDDENNNGATEYTANRNLGFLFYSLIGKCPGCIARTFAYILRLVSF
jgi:hypothetical protein